jgi:O-glycosyl hydrolase
MKLNIAFLLAGVALAQTAPDRKVVTVDPAATFQNFEGWGTSLCWWANIAGGFSQETRDRLARQIFTLEDGGLGLNVIRFNIGGGENPSIVNTMEPRARMDGYWPGPDQDFNWDADATQRGVLQDALRHAAATGNTLRFQVFSNSPPWWMTISKSATGRTGANGKPAENLDPEQYDNFAKYLATVTEFLQRTYSIKIESIAPFNEPTSDWWKYGGRQEGCYFTPGSMAKVVAVLDPYLNGTTTRIAAPEDWSLAQSLSSWSAFDQNTRDRISQIDTHTYNGMQRSALLARAERAAKKVWASEYGDGDKSGMTLAWTIAQDLKFLQSSVWVNWQVVSPGSWGMIVNDHVHEDWTKGKKYFVMAQFSRFIRPGFTIIGVDDSGTVAAYSADAGKLVLVYPNFSSKPSQISFDLSRFANLGDSAKWYQTELLQTDGDALAEKPSIKLDSGTLTADVSAGSLSTFVVDASCPTGQKSFAGSGIYFIRNRSTGLYLTIGGDEKDRASAPMRVADRTDDIDLDKQFRFDATSGGYFRLVDRYSGHDLNVGGASIQTGARVIQWWSTNSDQTATNSQWLPEAIGDGAFRIKARHSGHYLDVDSEGDVVQSALGSDSQIWVLERVGAANNEPKPSTPASSVPAKRVGPRMIPRKAQR